MKTTTTLPFRIALGEEPACEQCGEAKATIFEGSVSRCDDCYSQAATSALEAASLGKLCCRVLREPSGQMRLCAETYGEEHDHDER